LCITHPINAHHVLPKEASICESLDELGSSSVGTQGLSNQPLSVKIVLYITFERGKKTDTINIVT
jgi:hypothetical protein